VGASPLIARPCFCDDRQRAQDCRGEDPARVVVGEDSVLLREGIVRVLGEAGASRSWRRRAMPRSWCDGCPRGADVAGVDIRMPPTESTHRPTADFRPVVGIRGGP
jgi:hypothetical protein